MKIDINLRILLIIFLICIMYEIRIYLIFFICIILHELAHILIGLVLGLKINKVSFNPFGINIEFLKSGEKYKAFKKIIINLAGPILNFILSIIFYSISIDENLKIDLVYTNFCLGIFNLLPIMPLDGGKILKEIFNIKFGFKNSNIYILKVSKCMLVLISLIYSILIFKIKNVFLFFVILYLWYLYLIEERKLQTVIRVYRILEKV